MKALVANAYFYKLDKKQWRFKKPYPPLGTLLAAAVVRNLPIDVSVFDTNFRERPDEIIPVLREKKPELLILYDDGFNYLTKMCLTVMREAAFKLIQEGKKQGCIVIVASSDSTDHSEKYIEQGADVVIRGEGEETLSELLPALTAKANLDSIAGIVFKKGTEIVTTAPRSVLRDLDALPFPAWDLIDLDPYKETWLKHHGYFSLNIATTRGCPFKCNWCAKPIYGNRYNSRSPEHVAEEIQYLMRQHQPDHFWMCDDIFGLKPGWVQRFQSEVKKRNLKFRFTIQSRVDLLLETDVVESLKDTGVETVWVGAESGSQRILDAMDKGTTVSQIEKATRLLKNNGIKVAFFLQFGYLGEVKEDIEQTLQMVLKLMPEEIGISVSYPLPGTKFYESVKANLSEKQNWADSSDLSMMFKNTYSPAFYKILHRYIHGRYRVERGLRQIKKWTTSPFVPGWKSLKTMLSMVYHLPFTFIHHIQLRQLQ